MYSMSYLGQADEQSLRRAKGVQRDIVKTGLSHADYKRMYEDIFDVYVNEEDVVEGPSLAKRQLRFVSLRH